MTNDPSPEPVRRRYRRRAIALIALLAIGGAATALIWNLATDSNRPGAVVVFHIERSPRGLLRSRENPIPDEFESYAQDQEALVRSRRVIAKALNDPDVKMLNLMREAEPDPFSWIEANLHVTFNASKNHMRVELDGEDTSEVIVLLMALSRSYLSASHDADQQAHMRHLKELEEAHKELLQETTRRRGMISSLEQLSGERYRFLLHIRSPEEFARESKVASEELRRVRLERAILKACPPPVTEQLPASPLAAVGGGASLANLNMKSPRAASIEKELAAREQFWTSELRSAEARLEQYTSHWRELETLGRGMADKEELTKLIAVEIERCRLDLRALPRVSMAEEPYPRPRPR